MVHQSHELRGLPLWLLRTYLEELGGHEKYDRIVGEGWQASLTQLEDFQVGAIRVGQVRLDLEINEEVYNQFNAGLEKKLLRAGG